MPRKLRVRSLPTIPGPPSRAGFRISLRKPELGVAIRTEALGALSLRVELSKNIWWGPPNTGPLAAATPGAQQAKFTLLGEFYAGVSSAPPCTAQPKPTLLPS